MTPRTVIQRDGPPLPLEARWLFSIGRRSFHARHVRQWHVNAYRGRFERAKGDPARERRALRFLLRWVFPWRPSYALYDNPITMILEASVAEQTRALAEIIANVGLTPGHFLDSLMEARRV
jgi:hypothetical protein